MKSICYVVPYFGTLPGDAFRLWLKSCEKNPTVNWILFTDDKTQYNYPENVAVHYTTFDKLRERFQSHFDFPIVLDRGWKLCDYRPAYGEIFEEELKGFDFWGNCDIDLMFGNIRKFYTDEVLNKYDKVGFFGHSVLYKNTPEVNARYKTILNSKNNYINVLSNSEGVAFDEVGMEEIYRHLGISYFNDIVFANLTKYETKFHLGSMPERDEYKNDRQVFTWQDGTLLRHYLKDGRIYDEEYMYIHFWCRPMTYKVSDFSDSARYLIYSDVLSDKPFDLTPQLIEKKGRGNPVAFYAKTLWINRKKLTPERIIFNIKNSITSRKQ